MTHKGPERDFKVSVIMANYNYGKYITEAISSVLCQSYQNFELIIVDDGSTDNSREMINSFTDPRIKKLYQKNRGQAGAFNTGFNAANGDIIAFLDSDDQWYPDKLSIITMAHKNYDFVQHNLHYGDSKKPYRKYKYYHNHLKIMKTFGIIDFFVPTSGLSFKKDLLANFFPLPEKELRICADAFITRMSLFYSKLKCLDELLGYYRVDHSSFYTDQPHEKRLNIMKKVLRVLNKEILKMGQTAIPYYYYPAKNVVEKGLDTYRQASLLEKNGNYAKAEKMFKKVARIRTIRFKSGAMFHLGVINFNQAGYADAKKYLNKCLMFEPDHDQARLFLSRLEEKENGKNREK